MLNRTFVFAGLVALAAAASAGTEYYDQGSFVAALSPDYYNETFSSFTYGSPLNGSQTDWDAPGNGSYSFHAFASGGLWSNNQALSTNYAYDTIKITFGNSPKPVYAVGGNFQETDISGNNLAGSITLDFSDGHSTTLTNPMPGDFFGYISNVQITEMDIVSDNNANYADWVQWANAFVGAPATPEPATMTALGIGALALIRRRRAR